MYCNKCGKKLKENSKFCEECGAAIPNKNKSNVKKTLSNIDKKVEEKLPNNLKKNKNLLYIGVIVVVVIVGLFIFTGNGGSSVFGYSENVKKVRAWKSILLEHEGVTLGETMDYALSNAKWSDTTYEGKKAVMLTGVYKDRNVSMKAIFYPDYDETDEFYAYYEEDGDSRTSADVAFRAAEYASDAAESLGRD